MIDVGDRVRFKARGLPALEVDPPGTAPGETRSWQAHYGGLDGLVDVTDPLAGTVRVRGTDGDGHPYTVWIAPEHLTVTQAALDFGAVRAARAARPEKE
jgi:hypothetical protein